MHCIKGATPGASRAPGPVTKVCPGSDTGATTVTELAGTVITMLPVLERFPAPESDEPLAGRTVMTCRGGLGHVKR